METVFMAEQIASARRKKPFVIVPITQNMVLRYASFFSKTARVNNKSLNIQRAMVLDYSNKHAAEVWVKYGIEEDESWSNREASHMYIM